ncbi:hypothetical protein RJC38_10690 [Staphylococcus epidermidis]|uniref:hypothetical protein n=3 Tax=Staphylococcus TaxID=1279 RepID=UPI0024888930|nr:hypothetical protein [Staphylococcus epidermidis]ELL1200949.1 hypothetical protein [Staphylococcus aureus]MDH9287402.1 hypothetical protein [Staphylococcus epidermidis]MDS3974897.1 hypothetical protein [Staphylococcus epidermidis]
MVPLDEGASVKTLRECKIEVLHRAIRVLDDHYQTYLCHAIKSSAQILSWDNPDYPYKKAAEELVTVIRRALGNRLTLNCWLEDVHGIWAHEQKAFLLKETRVQWATYLINCVEAEREPD